MEKFIGKIDAKSLLLFLGILLLNLIVSLYLNGFQLPNWDVFSVKLISSFYLATLVPSVVKMMKEPIDPEYVFFILCFTLIGSSFVLSMVVGQIKLLYKTPLLIEREVLLMDILQISLIVIGSLLILVKTIYTMVTHKSKTRD
ncbi:hypothetical protein ACODG4_11910 [Vagococcus fluvialis]|uniref:hypothetical protein n=1 Tax=Vagococcus fluvialis TaxID=2738 RepID=UPI003B5C1566